MLKPFVIVLCAAGLVACASVPSEADFDACRDESDRARGVETQRSRLAFIDQCMARKGWRPTPTCVETMMQGTKFCDYVKAP